MLGQVGFKDGGEGWSGCMPTRIITIFTFRLRNVCVYFVGLFLTVYDVTRRYTLDAIADHWLPEVARHSTFPDAIKMVVGNKIDMVRGVRQYG